MTAQAPQPQRTPHDSPPGPGGAVRPRLTTPRKALFAAATSATVFLALIFVAEIALRIRHGKPMTFHSTLAEPFRRLGDAHAAYDERLGWVPRQGRWAFGNWSATVDHQALRTNGHPTSDHVVTTPPAPAAPAPGNRRTPLILAVGDSFTFGDEVDDEQTWPAQLQRQTGARVLNAGVFAYGIDQAVLRAEQFLASHAPDYLVLAVIADDVRRAECSYYAAHKPYFDLDGGQLVLRNTPVPTTPPAQPLQSLRSVLAYSYAARALAGRVAPDWWRGVTIRRAHDRGGDVSAALLRRLANAAADNNARLLVVAFGVSDRLGGNAGLAGTLRPAPDLLDLSSFPADPAGADAPLLTARFRPKGHYTPETNAWVARHLAHRLALPIRPTTASVTTTAGTPGVTQPAP